LRLTIREAVIALELEGSVEVSMGSGVYFIEKSKVKSRFSDNNVGSFELTEARALLESEAGPLAATMITDDELNELAQTLVAKTTINSVTFSYRMVIGTMRKVYDIAKRFYDNVCDSGLKRTIDEHQLIYDARKVHDAKEAMKNHLLSVIDTFFATTEIETVEAARS
jgi:DNA-binding FadR family transcriptional regulator